jgi:hypothetical protein
MQTSRDSSLVYAVTDGGSNGGGPTDTGVIPAFRTSDGLKVGQFDTQFEPNAIVFDSTGLDAATHSQLLVNRTAPGHAGLKHIHIFDASTFAELGTLNVSGHVTRNGMAVTAGDALLFLLSDAPDSFTPGSNASTANRIGVIF